MCKLKSKDNCVTLLGRENTGRMNRQNIIYCLYAFIIVINLRPPILMGLWHFLITPLPFIPVIGKNIPQ